MKNTKRVRERARPDDVRRKSMLVVTMTLFIFCQKNRISLNQIEFLVARILAETLDTSDIFSIVLLLA